MARGYSQKYGVDYHQTFALVARIQTIRLLCALEVELHMKIHQVDITAAYLNKYLKEKVLMKIPAIMSKMLLRMNREEKKTVLGKRAQRLLDAVEAGGDACLLKRSLYGLKQAGRQWHERISQKLTDIGLIQAKRETCMFYKIEGDAHLIVVIYVDDMLIASQDEELINRFKMNLTAEFELKDFGMAHYFLGIEN